MRCEYKDGLRGGKIKIRARIKALNAKTLVITEIPFTTTTGSLIDSILAANDKGKIKIKKVEGMGLGDAKLFLAIGAWLGINSLPFVLFVSSLLGSFYGIAYILIKKKNKNTEIAYGCFIILAVVLYQFFGKDFYNFINHSFVL